MSKSDCLKVDNSLAFISRVRLKTNLAFSRIREQITAQVPRGHLCCLPTSGNFPPRSALSLCHPCVFFGFFFCDLEIRDLEIGCHCCRTKFDRGFASGNFCPTDWKTSCSSFSLQVKACFPSPAGMARSNAAYPIEYLGRHSFKRVYSSFGKIKKKPRTGLVIQSIYH
jgi:hypothetical protein